MSLTITPGAVTRTSPTEDTGSIGETVVSGGTAPYTATWTNSAGATAIDSKTDFTSVSGLAEGTYTVTATDSVSATSTYAYEVFVTMGITPGTIDFAFSNRGRIYESEVTGGDGTFTYDWAEGPRSTTIVADTPGIKSGLRVGTYTLSATDASGETVSYPYVMRRRPLFHPYPSGFM
jgi:hypothetical protein